MYTLIIIIIIIIYMQKRSTPKDGIVSDWHAPCQSVYHSPATSTHRIKEEKEKTGE